MLAAVSVVAPALLSFNAPLAFQAPAARARVAMQEGEAAAPPPSPPPAAKASSNSNGVDYQIKVDAPPPLLTALASSQNPILGYWDPLQLGKQEFWGQSNDATIGWSQLEPRTAPRDPVHSVHAKLHH